MKKVIIILAILFLGLPSAKAQNENMASETTIGITRQFAKDLFELNGVPYLQPMVNAINATSNTGFYNTAYIPKQDTFYVKFSVHGMMGVVPDKYKTYTPQFPIEPLDLGKLNEYGDFDLINQSFDIQDTAGLIYYAFKTVLYDGVTQGRFPGVPDQASTILGTMDADLTLDPMVLDSLVRENIAFPFLPKDMQDSILSIVHQFPEQFTLPAGADISSIFAAVPQVVLGSYFGTEALIRYIPKVNLGENIGNFSFWGFGIKHSISQYIPDPYLDIAIQGVYQGTSLDNEVGVTEAQLEADATIFHANLQFSKSFEGIIDVYGGIGYESISIDSKYEYYLPIEVQYQLGMVKLDEATNELVADPPDYPGDTKVQTSTVNVEDSSIKGTFGVAKSFGGFRVFFDYNIRDYHIFQGGIQYTF
jgi:hypothetical protein